MDSISAEPTYLRPEQLANMLGIARQTLARWRCEGDGPPFTRAGRSVLYRRCDIDLWLEGRLRRSTSDPGVESNDAERAR